jgi:pimeloyl-ACP methyl ester carboxylesterase
MRTEPVILVHGWGGSFAETWRRPGWPALLEDAGRRVIGVDLLGHGGAPKPHDAASYADLGRRVIDALPPEPVDAIGFSLGAVTLLDVACRQPDRFARLVVAGVGASVFRRDDERLAAIVDAVEGKPTEDNVGRLFARYAAQPGNDPIALGACLRRPAAALTPERLRAITCPVLAVLGDQDPAGPGEPLVDALGDARLVMLRNVDHFATPEAFAFIDAALEFLEAIPA